MLRDRDTVIRDPHDAAVTRERGRKTVQVIDPRVSVAMQDEHATLTLFFDPADAHSGVAALLEVRLTPADSGEFQPWNLMPNLSLHLQYARASLAWRHDNSTAALRALRKIGTTRRGLQDDYLLIIAQKYQSLVAEGEPHPIKALAAAERVHKSTASRWVSAARQRGLLQEEES